MSDTPKHTPGQWEPLPFDTPQGWHHLLNPWQGVAEILVMWNDGDVLFFKGRHEWYINTCAGTSWTDVQPVCWKLESEVKAAQQSVVDEANMLLNIGIRRQE
jgi:hypothetical protein